MWREKNRDTLKAITIEEYLVKRKQEKKEQYERESQLLPVNTGWILMKLYR